MTRSRESGSHSPSMGIELQLKNVQRLESIPLPAKVIKNREWLANPDHWPILREMQRRRIMHPGELHIDILIANSRLGKTKFGADTAGAIEEDEKYLELLNNTEAAAAITPEGERKSLEIEIPLGDSQAAFAKALGKSKAELNSDQMRLGTQVQLQAIQALLLHFGNHPKYTVGVKLETVANTTMKKADRGTSTTKLLQHYPFTHNYIIQGDAEVETRASASRYYIRSHPDSPALNLILRNFGILDANIQGRAREFTESCGQDEHWRAQWTDMYEQIAGATIKTLFYAYYQPTLEMFLDPSFQRKRLEMYNEWMKVEGKEALGISDDKVTFVPNPFIATGVHYDDERLLGSGKRKSKVFPFHLLFADSQEKNGQLRPLSLLNDAMILAEMGLK